MIGKWLRDVTGYDPVVVDKVLFDFVTIATIWAWVWAVLHNYDAARLGVIGATVGLGVWGNLREKT